LVKACYTLYFFYLPCDVRFVVTKTIVRVIRS